MGKDELEGFRRQLLGMGQRLKGTVGELEQEAFRNTADDARGNLSKTPIHLADLGSDAFEQEITMSLLESEGQRLEEIAAALGRIEQGTYGRCERCGQEIARERLQAVPYTRFCRDCAEREENADVPGNL